MSTSTLPAKNFSAEEPLLASHETQKMMEIDENTPSPMFTILILAVATTIVCLDHFYVAHQDGKQLIDMCFHVGAFLGSYLLYRYQPELYTAFVPRHAFYIFIILICSGFLDLASLVLSLTSLGMAVVVVVTNTWKLLANKNIDSEDDTCSSNEANEYDDFIVAVV